MFTQDAIKLLKTREFISVATCDLEGHPNAAPKFFLKVEDGFIYLVDYIIGRTYNNIKLNPRVSLSFVDSKTLTGYQINGSVEIISKGKIYEKLCEEMRDRAIRLTTQHIIEHIRGKEKQDDFEVSISDKFVIFKIKIEEVTKIGPKGDLERDKVL